MFVEAPSIYSLKNEKAYSINLLDDITNYEYIPVGFKAGVQAIYTLEVSGLEGFEIVKLFDRQTNHIQDLKTNQTYSFASNPEDLPNRFEIHFGALSINESPNLTPAY
ncbi:hypothetical protein RZS08_51830, partial [Arthrospira platensis SPKY1]|nr:hypothetical protein [Arthrospira platensis SPKY1]